MRFPIPDGWSKSKLTELAKVQTGIAKGKKDLVDPISLPYLRVANVQDGHLNLAEVKKIEVSRTQVERFSLRDGDVLFTEGGDFDKLGRGTVWRNEIPNCLHQNHVFAVRVSSNSMLPYFLATYASSFWGRTYFRSCSKQTTNLASINSTQLKAMPLPVPPLPEQRKIAEILSTWDRAIELTEKMIAAKQKRKQALMQKLLTGKVRLPEFRSKKWRRCKLGDVTTEEKERNTDERVPREGVMAVNKTLGLIPMKAETIAEVITRYKVVSPSWFAYNPMRINVGSIAKSDHDRIVAVSPDYVVFSCNDGQLRSDFMFHVTKTHGWHRFVTSSGMGGVRVRIYYSEIAAMQIPCPELDEQAEICNILNGCDTEVMRLKDRLSLLQQQKRGLMQQLLTGKTRVKIDADGTEA